MPGPIPKDPALRQRRNKSSSRALLPPESSPIVRRPRLPENPTGAEWNPLTVSWWKDVWTSPQHHEFLRSDLGALFRLAILVDMFWKTGKLALAKEIRLLEREFGLTPLSRRRLEWTVMQTDEVRETQEQRRIHRAEVIDGGDPREVLNG